MATETPSRSAINIYMRIGVRIAGLLVTFAFLAAPVSGADALFTAHKKGLCSQCAQHEFPIAKPQHGVVFVSGSILSPEIEWIVLDMDSLKLSKVVAVRGKDSIAWVVSRREVRSIYRREIDPIIAVANTLWASGNLRPRRGPPTDGWQEVYLFDDESIRHELYVQQKEIADQILPALITLWNTRK